MLFFKRKKLTYFKLCDKVIKQGNILVLKEEMDMAKKMTSKTPLFGNRRSHACNATRHAQKPNYQKVKVDGKTVIMTSREIRTLKKNAA